MMHQVIQNALFGIAATAFVAEVVLFVAWLWPGMPYANRLDCYGGMAVAWGVMMMAAVLWSLGEKNV